LATGEKTISVNYFIEIVIIGQRLYVTAFNPYCSIKAKENIKNAGYRCLQTNSLKWMKALMVINRNIGFIDAGTLT
jgi:hypothetical protein